MITKNKTGIVIVILLLVALIVSVLALPVAAVNVDISAPGATNKVKLNASDILLTLFGDEDGFALSEEERAYLDKYSGESISYSDKLPSNNVSSEYDVQSGVLFVSAKVYTYNSVSGVKTVWTPASVVLGDETLPLTYDSSTGEYCVKIEGIEEGSIRTVKVTYTADIVFSEETLNSLRSKAYVDAVAWDKYAIYLLELENYTKQLELYKQYLVDQKIYDDKNIEYQAYLKEKAEYDEAKALFDQYEKDLAKYNSDYALYVKYLADKEAYDKNLKAYNDYVKNYAVMKAQLAVIDGTDKGLPTIGRPLRGAILGSTVTEVVNNKDAIANEVTGVHGSVVDEAGVATEKLRELFDGYFSKKDEADKYIYYSLNYEQFRDAFTKLLQTLDFLYQNGKVKFALGEMDMTWKFQILLAQLYYVVVALNDTKVAKYDGAGYFDSSYTIDKKKPITYVENVAYVKDPGTAAPIPGGYPVAVEKPVEPKPVSEPTKPVAVARPIAPNEVENPGEPPIPVAYPDVPTHIPAPDKKLVKDGVISSDVLALIDAYRSGRLTERRAISGDRQITLTAEATKSVLKVDEVTVNFYNADGKLISSVKAERGGYVEFSGKIPTKSSPDKIYTFVGWQTEDGTPVDMSAVMFEGSSISVYPSFVEETKKFTVTWNVENTVTEEEYEYGDVPTYSGVPVKERVGSENFEFVGWNRVITPVTADITYYAQFKPVPIVSDRNGMSVELDLESDPDRYIVDCTDNMGREFNLSGIIAVACEEMKGITVIFKTGTVSLSFAEVVAINNSGATVMSLSSTSASADGEGASFKLILKTPDGQIPDVKIRATVEIPATVSDLSNTTLTRLDGSSSTDVPSTITGTVIKAQIEVGAVYTTRREFGASVLTYDGVSLEIDKTACAPGDIVHVTYSVPRGMRVVKLYYIGADGDKTEILGGMFAMPAESVTVGLEYEYVTYTVRFTSDGRVIYTLTCKPGETPSFPGAPIKAADSDYTYTFVGWDKEFAPVDGNTVYNAVYEKSVIVREAPKEGLIVTDRVLKILVLVVVCLIYGGAVVLPCVVIVIVKIVRRCMKKLPRKAKYSSKN